jgi:type VI protein secretion system component VasF
MEGQTDHAAGSSEPTRVREMPLPRKVTFWGFAGLVMLAVAFYLWWGLAFGVWIDNGVYAVTITLLLFGLSGMWLVLPNPPTQAAPPR